MKRFLASAVIAALLPGLAWATPVLKSDVNVAGAIVAVGDMFDDAGALSSTPLFRAPKPGTTGIVTLADIAAAAARIGFDGYQTGTVDRVVVTRASERVDAQMLAAAVGAEIDNRGLHPAGTAMQVQLMQGDLSLNAAAVAEPAQLTELVYRDGGSGFTARFQVAGIDLPVDVSGRVDFTIDVPHLKFAVKAGDVIGPDDIEMKPVPADFADRVGVAQIDQLVGKAMKRNARSGMMLKVADVSEPLAVARNTQVTVLVHNGVMTLSMQGQALGDASVGEPVRVMNPVSNKILNGVASAAGTVEITLGGIAVAGL